MIIINPSSFNYFIVCNFPPNAILIIKFLMSIHMIDKNLDIHDFVNRYFTIGTNNCLIINSDGTLSIKPVSRVVTYEKIRYFISFKEFKKRFIRSKPSVGWNYFYIYDFINMKYTNKKWTNCKSDNFNLEMENVFTIESMIIREINKIKDMV